LSDIHTIVLAHVPTQHRHEHLPVILRGVPDVFLELSFPIIVFVVVKRDWLDRSARDALKQEIQVAEVAVFGRKLAVFVALDVLQRRNYQCLAATIRNVIYTWSKSSNRVLQFSQYPGFFRSSLTGNLTASVFVLFAFRITLGGGIALAPPAPLESA
jgi:hypothetical protein